MGRKDRNRNEPEIPSVQVAEEWYTGDVYGGWSVGDGLDMPRIEEEEEDEEEEIVETPRGRPVKQQPTQQKQHSKKGDKGKGKDNLSQQGKQNAKKSKQKQNGQNNAQTPKEHPDAAISDWAGPDYDTTPWGALPESTSGRVQGSDIGWNNASVTGASWSNPTGASNGWITGRGSGTAISIGAHERYFAPPPSIQQQQQRLASLLSHPATTSNAMWTPHWQADKIAGNNKNPSKTLKYASNVSILDGSLRDRPYGQIPVRESGGAALESADKALYSHTRPAHQRIHWLFSPDKDERVAHILQSIQYEPMSHALAILGVDMFLKSKDRGALIANASSYYDPANRGRPCFDWLTFGDAVETWDKTLQESILFYKPDKLVLVFVFLLSHTGNSMAIWRRKILIPDFVQQKSGHEIETLIKVLSQRNCCVTVDPELLPTNPLHSTSTVSAAAVKRKKFFGIF